MSDLVVVDLEGRVYGPGSPSSEIGLHLEAFRARPDVQAAVHAHPPWTIAASIQPDLQYDFVPEAIATLGNVAWMNYVRPGTAGVAGLLRPVIADANSFVLRRHGSLTVGKDLDQAYRRLETLEHTSKIALLALAAGHLSGLPEAEVEALKSGHHKPTEPASNVIRGKSLIRISDEEELVAGLNRRA
jgi:L-fuculose-phosphate aldolase